MEVSKNLKAKLNSIPEKLGIYQMKDFEDNIIYVGKSKNLKSRVRSYFNRNHESNKTQRMVFNIHDISFIVTDTHLEAQILECVLIKKLKPIYNIQFKNDKKYVYLKIENYNRFKPVSLSFERESENYIGPYRNKNVLLDTVKFFQNIYPISKFNSEYEFAYNILPQPMKEDKFEQNRECIIEIFNDEKCMEIFLSKLQKEMKKSASGLKFETATMYRDIIENIKYLYNNNTKHIQKTRNRKILLCEEIEDGYKIFYISDEKIILKKKYKSLTEKSIKEFLKKAEEIEVKNAYVIDEKRNLDFRKIIRSEIKSAEPKYVLFLDKEYELFQFVNLINRSN